MNSGEDWETQRAYGGENATCGIVKSLSPPVEPCGNESHTLLKGAAK